MISRRLFLGGCAALAACRDKAPAAASGASRVVTIGGGVTEIAFALGAGSSIVGTDTSSTFPAEAQSLPKVGYQRQIATEGILSLKPDRVVATSEAGPPDAIQQLVAAGIDVRKVELEPTLEGLLARIRAVGLALDRKAAGEEAAARVSLELEALGKELGGLPKGPRLLVVYARGAGTVHVAGRKTPADVVIGLSRSQNAGEALEGFQPLTPESLVGARPDVIVLPAHGATSLGGENGVLALPGMAETPAGKAKRVVTMDDLLLLGMGPRIAEAARTLAKQVRA